MIKPLIALHFIKLRGNPFTLRVPMYQSHNWSRCRLEMFAKPYMKRVLGVKTNYSKRRLIQVKLSAVRHLEVPHSLSRSLSESVSQYVSNFFKLVFKCHLKSSKASGTKLGSWRFDRKQTKPGKSCWPGWGLLVGGGWYIWRSNSSCLFSCRLL